MKVKNIETAKLKPYEKNSKKHTQKQVDSVAKSISEYGFVQPIVVDKNNVVVIGHCRLLASQQLGIAQVPCVCVDDLTPAQVKALRIVDNKTNESEWDLDLLQDELIDLPFDLSDFGLNIDDVEDEIYDKEEQHEEDSERTQNRVENILNLAKGQYEANNKYDIPELEPVYELPPIKEWISFNQVLSDKEPEGKAVHFFIDDYQFERIWNNPEKYLNKLRQYVCVATPDFSPYGDMPFVCQLYNHYRKHWVGAWLQERGVTVIPTIRASTDPRSLEWYLDGEPHNGIVIISSMWSSLEANEEITKQEYQKMKDVLNPKKIFIYGGKGKMGVQETDNVEYIDSFTRGRFG